MILFQQYCALDTATERRDTARMSFDCQLFPLSILPGCEFFHLHMKLR